VTRTRAVDTRVDAARRVDAAARVDGPVRVDALRLRIRTARGGLGMGSAGTGLDREGRITGDLPRAWRYLPRAPRPWRHHPGDG
jgi:hypothetical protein